MAASLNAIKSPPSSAPAFCAVLNDPTVLLSAPINTPPRIAAAPIPALAKAPNELPIENWEWTEDSEEYGIRGLYSEVGVVARDIATLRTQVNRMQSALKSVMTEQARVAAEKAVLEGDVTARLAGGNRPGSRGRR